MFSSTAIPYSARHYRRELELELEEGLALARQDRRVWGDVERERWIARSIAAREGVAYWPAFLHPARRGQGRLFAAAEAALAQIHGRYGEPCPQGCCARSRGGWDSMGAHGLSPWHAVQAWRLSGCRHTPKFEALCRILAESQWRDGERMSLLRLWRKSDSLKECLHVARGARWLHARQALHLYSRTCVRDLGRVSPELRVALISGCEPDPETGRVRALNWEAARQVRDAIAAAPAGRQARVRAAWAGSVRRSAELLGLPATALPEAVAAALCPAYPRVGLTLARRVARGERPVEVCPAGLSAAEAHAYLTAGAPEDLSRWLLAHLLTESDYAAVCDAGLHVDRVRGPTVARWLARLQQRGQFGALLTERATPVPGGEIRVWRALDLIDEIQDQDIAALSDGVPRVYERAAERLGVAHMAALSGDDKPLCAIPGWFTPRPWLVLLRSPAALVDEGEALRHCVGGYVDLVRAGTCALLSLRTPNGERSTVEIRDSAGSLAVVQHYGARNCAPSRRHKALLAAYLARVQRARR